MPIFVKPDYMIPRLSKRIKVSTEYLPVNANRTALDLVIPVAGREQMNLSRPDHTNLHPPSGTLFENIELVRVLAARQHDQFVSPVSIKVDMACSSTEFPILGRFRTLIRPEVYSGRKL
jgi:hypothetical protein